MYIYIHIWMYIFNLKFKFPNSNLNSTSCRHLFHKPRPQDHFSLSVSLINKFPHLGQRVSLCSRQTSLNSPRNLQNIHYPSYSHFPRKKNHQFYHLNRQASGSRYGHLPTFFMEDELFLWGFWISKALHNQEIAPTSRRLFRSQGLIR